MRILITGSAGFIGFHLVKKYLKNKNNRVVGIDSLNNYYSVNLKKKRLSILSSNKKFKFYKINLLQKKKLEKIIKEFNPEIIFHLAGQPGVLYSFKNPSSYKKNNTEATMIFCKICKKYNIKNFIFGSSSSVYGDQKTFPIKENFKKNPKNFYALTKFKCEKIVEKFFKNTKTNYKIFRFFTVYGPLGRPDMFIHKFLNALKYNKKIKLHNSGKNYRDFTYVGDVVRILFSQHKIKDNSKIFNICRSKPIKTISLISLIKKKYNVKEFNKINLTGFIRGEMLKTHGSNKKIIKNFRNFKFTSFETGLNNTINAFKLYGG